MAAKAFALLRINEQSDLAQHPLIVQAIEALDDSLVDITGLKQVAADETLSAIMSPEEAKHTVVGR